MKREESNVRFGRAGLLFDGRGVALIMVLWVIAILAVVVLEFSFAMRTEVNISRLYKEDLQLYGMAKGGIHRAIAELMYKHDPKIQQMRRTLKPEETPPEQREWVTDGRPYKVSFEQGTAEVRIMSESGKININTSSDQMLRKIMGNLGLEGEKKDVVVDSILDWRDPDDFYRVNGAENDYYQSLKEPYQCKNGNFDSVEELLLVRGMTPDLFYGKRGPRTGEEEPKTERVGLKDVLSIFAQGEQVDINSAAPVVMKFVLGIPDDMARLIVKAREEKVLENQPDLLRRVPEVSPLIGEIGRFLLYRSMTSYYTIESRAKVKGDVTVRGIKVIVKIDQREKDGYKFIQWVDVIS